MAVQIGLVGQRADLALEVASLASRAGASVTALDPFDGLQAASGDGPAPDVDLVLVDAVAGAATAVRVAASPPGVPVVVICRAGEVDGAREAALRLGSAHVVELPAGAPWLVSQLAPEPGAAVLGVVGAVGGVGTTTVAIACAVGAGSDCLLVDADPDSPGLDLPLGIPEGAGARWSQIPDTPDPLDPASLRSALPQVGAVSVVTGSGIGSRTATEGGRVGAPGSGRVAGILGVGRSEFGRTVVDAGRGAPPVGLLGPADALALVLPATLAGVVAGRRVLADIATHQVVVLLRPSGWLPADEVAAQLGVPAVLEVPRLRRAAELADCGDLLTGRTGRALCQLGAQVWGELG